jgi:hypothetical protein
MDVALRVFVVVAAGNLALLSSQMPALIPFSLFFEEDLLHLEQILEVRIVLDIAISSWFEDALAGGVKDIPIAPGLSFFLW